MNPNNYASLEASKRLVDAGIVLESDFLWCLTRCKHGEKHWQLRMNPHVWKQSYPAPCMAEVLRELPTTVPDKELYAPMILRKAGDGKTWGSYFRDGRQIIESIKADTNPTDALIDLLIWARKEKK